MFQQEINQYLTTHHYTRIDLKAVLFDMDGVLFDSMKNHATAWHKAMKQYGMSLSKEEAYLHEGRTGAATINIVSQRERGYEADEEEIKRIYQTKSDIFNQLPKADPMPGAFEVLKKNKSRRTDSDGCNRLRTTLVIGQVEPLLPRHLPTRTDGNRF